MAFPRDLASTTQLPVAFGIQTRYGVAGATGTVDAHYRFTMRRTATSTVTVPAGTFQGCEFILDGFTVGGSTAVGNKPATPFSCSANVTQFFGAAGLLREQVSNETCSPAGLTIVRGGITELLEASVSAQSVPQGLPGER